MVNIDLIHYGSLLHYSMVLVVKVDKYEVCIACHKTER